jgi:hypothetical protein
MPRIEEFADRDEVLQKTLHLMSPSGKKVNLQIGFYPNRVTQTPVTLDPSEEEGEDETGLTGLRNAAQTCEWVESWDIEGAVRKPDGEQVFDGPGTVPLDPHVVRYLPSWITSAINDRLLDVVFPNRNGSPGSRRR